MSSDEKSYLRFIEDKLIDVLAMYSDRADPIMIARLSRIQSMLCTLKDNQSGVNWK